MRIALIISGIIILLPSVASIIYILSLINEIVEHPSHIEIILSSIARIFIAMWIVFYGYEILDSFINVVNRNSLANNINTNSLRKTCFWAAGLILLLGISVSFVTGNIIGFIISLAYAFAQINYGILVKKYFTNNTHFF